MTTYQTPDSRHDVAHYLEAVGDALKAVLASYTETFPPTLVQISKMALSTPGKVMAETLVRLTGEGDPTSLPLPRWPLSVILSYRAALLDGERESWREAIPAAVALEIAVAATDILDELADGDPSPIISAYGPGQAMNTANLMLVVAQQTLLKRGMEQAGERALDALNALLDVGVQAGVGQHLDMSYSEMGPQEVTLDMSAHATSLKAGTLVGGACRIGALMAGAQGEVLELLTRFGREMGNMGQVLNDIQDVLPQAVVSDSDNIGGRKSDLRMRKRTLPVVYTLREEREGPNALQRAFAGDAGSQPRDEVLTQAILDAGGVQFAQLVIEVHRQNLLQTLEELEALRPGARRELAPLFAAD